jgi:DNA-directed RNA polymerase III subunit RPC11
MKHFIFCYYYLQIGPHLGGAQQSSSFHFYCSTCPYICSMNNHDGQQRYTAKTTCQRKQVDDILGGAAAWENVDRTHAVCPACHHDSAYFMQMQIRSADEPMSIFYKCVSCAHQWNDK